jgi:hypothetical protein
MKKQSIVENLTWLEKILSMGNKLMNEKMFFKCGILDFLGGYQILSC